MIILYRYISQCRIIPREEITVEQSRLGSSTHSAAPVESLQLREVNFFPSHLYPVLCFDLSLMSNCLNKNMKTQISYLHQIVFRDTVLIQTQQRSIFIKEAINIIAALLKVKEIFTILYKTFGFLKLSFQNRIFTLPSYIKGPIKINVIHCQKKGKASLKICSA